MSSTLHDRQEKIADREFEAYDFQGSDAVDKDGWSSTNPGNEFSRTLYFENDEEPDGDTLQGHFTVVFENDSDVVLDVYAVLDGNLFGQRGIVADTDPDQSSMAF